MVIAVGQADDVYEPLLRRCLIGLQGFLVRRLPVICPFDEVPCSFPQVVLYR